MSNNKYTPIEQLIQWCIKNAFNIQGQDGTKYVAIDYEEMRQQFGNLLNIEKAAIVDAFDNGQANHDAKCQDYKNGAEYFDSLFTRTMDLLDTNKTT